MDTLTQDISTVFAHGVDCDLMQELTNHLTRAIQRLKEARRAAAQERVIARPAKRLRTSKPSSAFPRQEGASGTAGTSRATGTQRLLGGIAQYVLVGCHRGLRCTTHAHIGARHRQLETTLTSMQQTMQEALAASARREEERARREEERANKIADALALLAQHVASRQS